MQVAACQESASPMCIFLAFCAPPTEASIPQILRLGCLTGTWLESAVLVTWWVVCEGETAGVAGWLLASQPVVVLPSKVCSPEPRASGLVPLNGKKLLHKPSAVKHFAWLCCFQVVLGCLFSCRVMLGCCLWWRGGQKKEARSCAVFRGRLADVTFLSCLPASPG